MCLFAGRGGCKQEDVDASVHSSVHVGEVGGGGIRAVR